jgi:hypothetical protein
LLEPRWARRRITAAEAVRLVQGDDVPGINSDAPGVECLRQGLHGSLARVAFSEARRLGYLFVNEVLYRDAGEAAQLRAVWGWWCAAAGHPELVLRPVAGGNGARIRCDLSPTGLDWSFRAFGLIGSLVGSLATDDEGNWLFTRDELQLDGVPLDDAVHMTWALVNLATASRFRPEPEHLGYQHPQQAHGLDSDGALLPRPAWLIEALG